MLTENALANHDFQTADTMFSLYVEQTGKALMKNSAVPVTVTEYRDRAYRSESLAESLRKHNRSLYLIIFVILFVVLIILISLFLNFRFYKELIAMNLLIYWLRNKQNPTDRLLPLPLPETLPPGEGKRQALLPSAVPAISEIRQQLISTVCGQIGQPTSINPVLHDSTLRLTIRDMAAKKKNIPDKSDIWSQIEYLVKSAYPHFISNLTILLGKYNETRFRVCMLILMGITPSEISVLLAKKLSNITYHRKIICRDAFDKRVSPDRLANAISILAAL